MDIADFLSPDDVLVDVRASSKQGLLKELVTRAATAFKLSAETLLSELMKREELGSTGLGDGVALPHTRIAEIKKPLGVLASLKRPVDFEAIDGKPVDLVFLLLLPAEPHGEQLNALASVARKLRDKGVRKRMREASDARALRSAITADSVT
jgi:PTS system nitrogen regulatory IIA component